MKKKKSLLIRILPLIFCVFLFTGCTSDFCSKTDKANIKSYLLEQYETSWREEAVEAGKTTDEEIQKYVDSELSKEYKKFDKKCIVIKDYESESGVTYEKKTWGDAWKEGLMEGLLVYPISALMILFINWFGATGTAKFFALVMVTFVIKLLVLAATWKSTRQTQKLQEIQPELLAINEAYSKATTQAEKQKYALKMQAIYSKYKINPLSMLLMPFITMPIFIAVWGAVQNVTILQEGAFLGLSFGTKLSTQVFDGNLFGIVLFIIMILGQFLSMKLSSWLANRKAKKQGKVVKPQKMNGTMIFMLVLVLWTGFFLPSAMAIYWTLGSVFSVLQTLVMHYLNSLNKGGKKYEKVYK